jgi:hypothetical protein
LEIGVPLLSATRPVTVTVPVPVATELFSVAVALEHAVSTSASEIALSVMIPFIGASSLWFD